SGPGDSTATKGNYPPSRPILEGDFYPVPGSATNAVGQGSDAHIMVGGWKNGQRGGDLPAETRASTFPGGDSGGIMSAGAAAAKIAPAPASPVNTADAGNVSRPQPTDPDGTRNGAWSKTAGYPFTPDNQAAGPWKQT
ncbi:MAG: hypothetical protein M3Y33_11430, partial [Actinomycetota bacterium]|nr:hypothetical protein [Actinomycetota bacterium]